MLDGKCKPLIISCHNFLLMTSTKPPRAITKLYNSYKSKTDLAIIGNRLIGVPAKRTKKTNIMLIIYLYFALRSIQSQIIRVECLINNAVRVRLSIQLFLTKNDSLDQNVQLFLFGLHCILSLTIYVVDVMLSHKFKWCNFSVFFLFSFHKRNIFHYSHIQARPFYIHY